LKNLAELAGRPLLDYGISAALTWGKLDRIICSTDDPAIADRARSLGVEIDPRPLELAQDHSAVADVAREMLGRMADAGVVLPEWLFLIQPTSPFVLPEHFARLAEQLETVAGAQSGQTVAAVPHNHHAWNQRVADGDRIDFLHAADRARAYNKQSKPRLYVFGNLVATRTSALLGGADFFAQPSCCVVIQRPYDLDIDGPDDLLVADALLARGAIQLAMK
jgi:CMP-N-acetylneuraminic acid synthetase